MKYAGLDVGTTGCKIVIFNENGNELFNVYRGYRVIHENGVDEIDSLSFISAIKEVVKEAFNAHPDVYGLGIDSFGESFILLDDKDNPLDNIIISSDPRGTDELNELLSKIDEKYIKDITGLKPSSTYSLAKIMWIKKHKPDIYSKTKKILLIEDAIIYLLTGKAVIDYSLATRTMAFDLKALAWDVNILNTASVDVSLLSKPVQLGYDAGNIKEGLQNELLINTKVKILTAGHDQVSVALGSGIVLENTATDGAGTVECITPVFKDLSKKEYLTNNNYALVPYIDNTYVTYAFTYTFAGWNTNIATVESDQDYVATYYGEYKNYTITFQDDDSTVISSNQYHYNEKIIVPSDPSKDATDQYTYTFNGWSPEVPELVNGDATFVATYSSTINNYSVTWKNYDGTTLEIDEDVPYGTLPTYDGAAPIKDRSGQYKYQFKGWDPEIDEVTGNVIYTATFDEIDLYVLTFNLDNGETNIIYYLDEGDEVPSVDSPSKEGYTFEGWDKDIPEYMPGNDLTITATYNGIEITVTFNPNGGTCTVNEKVVRYGDAYGALPTPQKDGFAFKGWFTKESGGNKVTTTSQVANLENHTLYASWENDLVNYNVSINEPENGEVSISASTIKAGEEVLITFEPESGYVIDKVLINDTDYAENVLDDELTLIVNSNLDIEVTYKQKTAEGGCSSSVTGSLTIAVISALSLGGIIILKAKRKDD